jgi:WD40 repeat protein
VKVWNVGGGECVKTLSGHSRKVLSVSFSPDGTLLTSASVYGTVKVWNVRSGTETSQKMWDAIGKKDSPIEAIGNEKYRVSSDGCVLRRRGRALSH